MPNNNKNNTSVIKENFKSTTIKRMTTTSSILEKSEKKKTFSMNSSKMSLGMAEHTVTVCGGLSGDGFFMRTSGQSGYFSKYFVMKRRPPAPMSTLVYTRCASICNQACFRNILYYLRGAAIIGYFLLKKNFQGMTILPSRFLRKFRR